MFKLLPIHLSIAIGLLVGDAWFANRIYKGVITSTAIGLEWTIRSLELFLVIFFQFSPFCSSFPYVRTRFYKGKFNTSICFQTRRLPCFGELRELFYFGGGKTKEISPLLFYFFDEISLAYWIMSDGRWLGYGLELCCEGFSPNSVKLLMIILTNKYNLICTIHIINKSKNHYRIYISAKSMPHLRALVKPYIHPIFNYKLGLHNGPLTSLHQN
jgi:hypothetical protein